MINEVIDAISIKLNEVFEYAEIYVNEIKQGLKGPCFLISVVEDNISNRVICDNGFLNMTIAVRYFPETDNVKEMNDVKMKLYSELLYVKCIDESLIKTMNMSSNVIDDGLGNVLHFILQYKIPICRVNKLKVYMEELKINRRVDNGN